MQHNVRGYLLLEVAIGGALIAVVCATLLSSLADARVKNIVAGRDVIAAQLALAKVEQQRALGQGNITAASCGNDTPPGYTRSCTFAANNQTVNGVALNCTDIDVSVTFNTDARAGTNTRTINLQSRVCQ